MVTIWNAISIIALAQSNPLKAVTEPVENSIDAGAEHVTIVRAQGLPGNTFEYAPTALWRVRFDTERNLIAVSNGHRDFVYANRSTSLKLRYIARLYAKEPVQKNFPGASAAELSERMIELTLYMEENLR